MSVRALTLPRKSPPCASGAPNPEHVAVWLASLDALDALREAIHAMPEELVGRDHALLHEYCELIGEVLLGIRPRRQSS
jgi:hypothetical protein